MRGVGSQRFLAEYAISKPSRFLFLIATLMVPLVQSAEPKFDALVAPAATEFEPKLKQLPRFNSFAKALAAAPGHGDYTIGVASGDYYEKVTIDRPRVSLVALPGQATKPRLYFDAYAGMSAQYHREGWGTPGSATLTINAPDVTLSGLHIENSFAFIANDRLPADDPKRIRHSQAVALLLDTGSDRTLVADSQIDGNQDTVFVNAGSSYFYRSRISGNVDFIFGAGLAVFDQCEIVSRPRAKPFSVGEVQGHITAPSTNIERPWGLVFIHSRLTREEGIPDNSVSLGRPWHPTTTFVDGRYADPEAIGSAIYLDTWMDAHIIEVGWANMKGTARDGTKSRVFTPTESRFFERNSQGPGADEHSDRRALGKDNYQALVKAVKRLQTAVGLDRPVAN